MYKKVTYMLYKNLYTHAICYTKYKCKKLADSLTSIRIGLAVQLIYF